MTTFDHNEKKRTFQINIRDGTESTYTKSLQLLFMGESKDWKTQKYQQTTILSDSLSHINIILEELEKKENSTGRVFNKYYLESAQIYRLRYIFEQQIQLISDQIELKVTLEDAHVEDYIKGVDQYHFYIAIVTLISLLILILYAVKASDKEVSSFFSFIVMKGSLDFVQLILIWDIFHKDDLFSIGMRIGIRFEAIYLCISLFVVACIIFGFRENQNNLLTILSHLAAFALLIYDINLITVAVYTAIHLVSLLLSKQHANGQKYDNGIFCIRSVLILLTVVHFLLLNQLAEETPKHYSSYLFKEITFKIISFSPSVITIVGINAILSFDFLATNILKLIEHLKNKAKRILSAKAEEQKRENRNKKLQLNSHLPFSDEQLGSADPVQNKKLIFSCYSRLFQTDQTLCLVQSCKKCLESSVISFSTAKIASSKLRT